MRCILILYIAMYNLNLIPIYLVSAIYIALFHCFGRNFLQTETLLFLINRTLRFRKLFNSLILRERCDPVIYESY